jgi:non-lysosomal glucosylceramidase
LSLYRRITNFIFLLFSIQLCLAVSPVLAVTNIPSQAWSRDINAGGYTDGAPVGGFGAGCYTWNFAGDFYLGRLNTATSPTTWTNNAPYAIDSNCHFYMYQKPSGQAAVTTMLTAASLGTGQATYYSLYPKAWVDYYGSDFPCKARVTQFTPLIAGDYTRSSFPEGIYEWDLSNPTCTATDVAVMLTWDNTFGGTSASVTTSGNNTGLVLTRTGGNATSKSQGEFTLACSSGTGITVTYQSSGSVANLQTSFGAAGTLANSVGNNTIGGIAFKVTLAPGQSVKIPMVLAWDIPLSQPGTGAQWYREYTRTYGRTGLNSFAIANDALANYTAWESSIDGWQAGILSGPYPDWFKQMLFNELYYYVIGGTLWEAGQYGSTQYDAGPDMFSSMESYIYPFYGTSDVRFYSSWALAQNWPNIDKQEVEQFCDSVTLAGTPPIPRPAALGTCAHDFGSLNDVFTAWNDYTYRDSTTWKDLNSKLVLMVYRDWELTGKTDTAFLNYCWPAIQVAMSKVHGQCVSGGVTYNLPISNGIDQTYDNLGLTGETAYCGSLYLAACEAAQAIATTEGNAALASNYQTWLTQGQADFEGNLWNAAGGYYDIDTGSGAGGVTGVARIMTDQLCGEWYAKACGLADVVPTAHAVSAWQAVHDNNWAKFTPGTYGAVNVMTSAGNIDTSTSQSQESWVGTTWGAVSGMIQEGMFTQAVSIGNSLYNAIWNTGQMWFRTPEAWTSGLNNIRAPYYMRANAIWGAKHAYDVNSPCGGTACTPIPSSTPIPTATSLCPSPTFTFTPNLSITATPTTSPTITQTPTATTNPCTSVYEALDCGASANSTIGGVTWLADKAYAAGSYGYVGAVTIATISNTITKSGALQPIYQSEAYAPAVTYEFTVPNGSYLVTLLNTEVYCTTTGCRVFNVAINGTTVLPNFDVYADTGGEFVADSHTFPVNVANGVITITGTATANNAEFEGIEITSNNACSPTPTNTNPPYTATNTPTPSPTPTKSSTPTVTNSPTPTFSLTGTWTPTWSFTNTPTNSPTASFTPTITGTPTETGIYTSTVTLSPTNTATPTATSTPTRTYSPTATSTPTSTLTRTVTPSWTATPSFTATGSLTATPTATGTATPTPSMTPTKTLTPTSTGTPTWTSTPTPTNSFTATGTSTSTPSMTLTPTKTFTPTPTGTPIWTSTPTFTSSPTASGTATPTSTRTSSPTYTPTYTFTYTPTGTNTPMPTATSTSTANVVATLVSVATQPVLYPNPSNGAPVSVGMPGLTTHTPIKLQVFTLAFRKVLEETMNASPASPMISFSPVDKADNPLSNGLYYVVVTTPSHRYLLKLLVLR